MYRYCLFLFIVFNYVTCQDCVTDDFEDGLDHFTHSGVCRNYSMWKIEEYSSMGVEGPNPRSTRFILAESGMRCISSYKFTMTAGGTLEVTVYSKLVSIFDQLTIRVFRSVVGEHDILIGTAVYISNSFPVWDTLRMTINGHGSFEGYITFQAFATSPYPIIWIDSFRYIGPSLDMDSCVIYEEDHIISQTSTTIRTTIETPSSTTPQEPVEDCLTEDFENNFTDSFTNNYGVCIGLSTWDIQQYSSVNITSPHPGSTSFIAPRFGSSCVASHKFTISAGGTVQVNVYMVPTSPVDQLTVTVFQSVVEGDDVPITRLFLNAMSPGFVDGWQKINLTMDGPDTFEGYVTFQALTFSSNPFIWIDSFRYIGPTLDIDSCVIYEEGLTTIFLTPTTASTTAEAFNEDCLTEDFENNFEDNFTNSHGVCIGSSAWDNQQYSIVNISSPHPESTSFIMPRFGSSCVASTKFEITTGSKIQVNVYMVPTSPVDQLTVTVYQSVFKGDDDIPISRVFLNEMSSGFIFGWQTLNINIDKPDRFQGYVTFQALAFSSNPTIWIDSYRYIRPSLNIDSCLIYEDNPTITQTPITPTTTTVSVTPTKTTSKVSTTTTSEGLTTIIPVASTTNTPEKSTTTTPEESTTTIPEESTTNSSEELTTTTPETTITSEASTTTSLESSSTTLPEVPTTTSTEAQTKSSYEASTATSPDAITTTSPETSKTTTSSEAPTTTSSEASTTTTTEEPNDDCLTEDFENNFEDNFTNNYGVCAVFSVWYIQQYSSMNISSPHPDSTSFIAPPIGSSCISSYKFMMTAGGTLQVNLYMQPSSQLIDQLTVIVFQSVIGGTDVPIGRGFLSATTPDFVNGWQVLNIAIHGSDTFEGYVTFQAWALSTNPVIWIDSFRYIGPSLDIESCMIYK